MHKTPPILWIAMVIYGAWLIGTWDLPLVPGCQVVDQQQAHNDRAQECCATLGATLVRHTVPVVEFIGAHEKTFFDGLLVVATLLLAGATIWLVRGANRTAERQLRAYLALTPHGVIYDTARELLFVCAEQANMGQTPAKHVRFSGIVRALPHPLPTGFVFPEKFLPGQNVVHPGKKFGTQTLFARYPTPGQLLAAGANNQRIYFFGLLIYDDVFGERRTTRACWSHHPNLIAPNGNGQRFDTDFDYTEEYNDVT